MKKGRGRERTRAVVVPAGSALRRLSDIITPPAGKTADDVRYHALAEKHELTGRIKRVRPR